MKELAILILASIEGCYQLATTAQEVLPKGFAAKTLKYLIGARDQIICGLFQDWTVYINKKTGVINSRFHDSKT